MTKIKDFAFLAFVLAVYVLASWLDVDMAGA